MVSSTHEQNSICSQKKLNDIVHKHTIICRQLFAGHVVGSRPMKRKKHLHRMIIVNYSGALARQARQRSTMDKNLVNYPSEKIWL